MPGPRSPISPLRSDTKLWSPPRKRKWLISWAFCGCRTAPGCPRRLRLVARNATGATDKAPVLPAGDLGLLTAPCIREAAERPPPSIAAGIARDGVNAARLRREQQEEGRFSYLLGDHAVAETSFSTMF